MEILLAVQIIIAVVMMVAILLQKGDSSLGTVFGGSVTSNFKTRRGFEAFLFNLTIFLGFIFTANALAIIIMGTAA